MLCLLQVGFCAFSLRTGEKNHFLQGDMLRPHVEQKVHTKYCDNLVQHTVRESKRSLYYVQVFQSSVQVLPSALLAPVTEDWLRKLNGPNALRQRSISNMHHGVNYRQLLSRCGLLWVAMSCLAMAGRQ